MKPRFEKHDNQLFRMLEEPEPLTPDAEMPCLVRLIQDETQMGKYNNDMNCWDTIKDMLWITRNIKGNPLFNKTLHAYEKDSNGQDSCIASIHQLEIIGYPVEEGSRWWALYQMMQGKKVSNKGATGNVYLALNQDGNVQYYDMDNLAYIGTIRSKLEFGKKDVVKTGWQLYEPKPEPKERPLRNLILRAKEQGMNIRTWYQDLIFTPESLTSYLNNGKYRWWNIGDWELTKREANMPMPEPEPPREPEYVICKRCGGTGYEIKEQKPDNLYLNINPSNPVDWCFDKKNLLVLVDDNFKGIVGENVTREQVGEIAKLLTEPAKEQFDVGDWVEFIDAGGRKSQGKYLSNTDDRHYAILVLDTSNMRCVVPTTKIIRKLSPIDVEVDFGFAKGRILSRTSGDVKVLNNKSVVIASIIVSEITNPTTRSLVESLLEAMKEEEK